MNKISMLVVFLLVIVLASPLLANLPSYFESADPLDKNEPVSSSIIVTESQNPFEDMSDREYLHLTEQGQFSKQ